MAQQVKRDGLTALQGRRCGGCNQPILSELTTAGRCEECARDICQACWAIRKVRRCADHAETPDATAAKVSASDRGLGDRTSEPERIGKRGPKDLTAEINRLREEGRPAVTAVEARVVEEGFIRAFAQRLEAIDELPDPLNKRVIVLRTARAKHMLEPHSGAAGAGPRNTVSRFTLRTGGWGKPKAGLVLEARFLSRAEAYSSDGYDAHALGEAELTPVLKDLRDRAKKEGCFHVVQLGSPTGWDAAARKLITQRQAGRAFHDRRVAVTLYDLHGEAEHMNESDERLVPFWPLVAPMHFQQETALCSDRLRELAGKLADVSLDYAAKRLGVAAPIVRAAFDELARTGVFKLEKLPDLGLVLMRL